MEYRESLPPKEVVCIGIPITGIGKIAAHIPGRCAAIPAPAMITFHPLLSADFAYSKNTSGSLCAEMIVISYSTPSSSSTSAAFAITGISESLPITIPTFAMVLFSFVYYYFNPYYGSCFTESLQLFILLTPTRLVNFFVKAVYLTLQSPEAQICRPL